MDLKNNNTKYDNVKNEKLNLEAEMQCDKKRNYNMGRIILHDECYRIVILEAAKINMLPRDYLMIIVSNELAS